MRDGFIKVAAVTPDVRVADPLFNVERIETLIAEASAKGARIIVFPELSLSGYTCGDLFLQESLLLECRQQLKNIVEFSADFDALIFVGLPFEKNGKIYNVAAVVHRGLLLCLIPKKTILNFGEFSDGRYFAQGPDTAEDAEFFGVDIPFGTHILLENDSLPCPFRVCAEIGEDAFALLPPSLGHVKAGAHLIVNLAAGVAGAGKAEFRRILISSLSSRLVCAYAYAAAGEGESTTDLVFAGDSLISENGSILAQATLFKNGITYGDIDVERIRGDRRRNSSFSDMEEDDYLRIPFHLSETETVLTRIPDPSPFIPGDEDKLFLRCEEVLSIQAQGLKKRLQHIRTKYACVGISGGLDSTLALLVTVRAFDSLGYDRKGITAVTMPCFGTTDRTYQNAVNLIRVLGADFKEIDIRESVRRHFRDIGQDENKHDVTYENSQARERTQVLMDLANQNGGLVVGTGDLSELALGWATYNGDHMSMYGVNGGVPKTLVRHLVRHYAQTCGNEELKATLLDILDTPVSPELLPPKEGQISQQTEDLVGPYELHDFFLYYVLRFGFRPGKIYRLARLAFGDSYSGETVLKWLRTFYRRFFTQQFKRSCLADGPKVGTVGVSPRGDLHMPSDASMELWIREVDALRP
ncbi:MAG: NAD(+) synthase [Lachnospiraceae bacterium]|nr:NAD(+) synthase [Lachnospiraceae bacterium]